jgi:hypothetical protein
MSHTVKIQTKFKNENFNAFRRALEQYGWTLKENAKGRTYPNDPASNTIYPYVAVNPAAGSNSYDLGIKIEGDDIAIYGDFYGGSITKELGQDLNELRKEYAYRVIEERLTNEGYTVERTVQENGIVDVVAN